MGNIYIQTLAVPSNGEGRHALLIGILSFRYHHPQILDRPTDLHQHQGQCLVLTTLLWPTLTQRHRWYLAFWALHLALKMPKPTGQSPSLQELLIWERQTSEQVDVMHKDTLKYRINTEKAMSPRVRKASWFRG